MKDNIKIGITQGDINGVGYEVIMKALSDLRMLELCTPVIYGSPKVAAYHRKVLNMETFNFHQVRSAGETDRGKINIVNCCDDNVRVELGKSSPQAGEAAYLALERASNDLKDGIIDALVTAPINKDSIQSDLFNFPGHTEFLARELDCDDYLMLLIADDFRVGVVTGHIPLRDVADSLSVDIILKKIKTMHASLVRDFSCTNPRIAVLGLNPHAGDNGLLGSEEKEIIKPAIDKAFEMGITALGPYAPDGFFGSGQHHRFDAILAMYHDQGLTPFKALTFDSGVNYTAGLPVVRTSPDHGTAFDIVGTDKASGESLKKAIYMAIDIYRNREVYKEAAKNPLQKYEIRSNGESDHVDLTKEEDSDY